MSIASNGMIKIYKLIGTFQKSQSFLTEMRMELNLKIQVFINSYCKELDTYNKHHNIKSSMNFLTMF